MEESYSLWSFFHDPVLRGPTIGSMLMCLAASLVGVIVFLRKQTLVGETLSHASYPGVIMGVLLAGSLDIRETDDVPLALCILAGAMATSLLGLFCIYFLEKKMRVSSDTALCFVLSTFFGIGLTMTSEVQFSHTSLYKQVLTYLYGQAATMTDAHILIYGFLSLIVALIVLIFYKEIKVLTFDRNYAKSLGVPVHRLDALLLFLVTLAVIIGIRSVGVVLMSAMLIAPAAAARQWTNRLSKMFLLAPLFGLASGFFGNYFSVHLSESLAFHFPTARIILPTGPMIVIAASFFCIGSLLFSFERGLVFRFVRSAQFRFQCLCENLLKTIWRLSQTGPVPFASLARTQGFSKIYLEFVLWRLQKNGWVEKTAQGHYELTPYGNARAEKIVRLHRLWEVYLVEYLGANQERVHYNAEEIEHILTPELEEELTLLLNNPRHDPHHQPIPQKDSHVF
ncbi:MAG: metal ABC transporter permease [Parachlamydia sp.]|jgi:manganese/zinc/iron transport system permease protein|nr:metal ABC transporter permease [Parachlamydia sp.]